MPTLPNILLVEDDATIRMVLCEILALQSVTVRSASDGQTALQLIQDALPDILISDLHMPGMSGFELLALVRQAYPEIHLIATSGAYGGPAIPSGVAADGYYEKTSGIRNLIALVEHGAQRTTQRIQPQTEHQNYSAAA